MTAILMTRTLSGLAPDDDAARDVLRKVAVNETVRVDIQHPRSHKNLRRWWALMNLIAQNSDTVKSPEQAHDLVKILAGHCSHIVSKSTGEVYMVADSIAFGRLSEDEFLIVWENAKRAVAEHIMPGIDDATIEGEVLNLLGGGTWQR